jgi:FkbM family methyltransferase
MTQIPIVSLAPDQMEESGLVTGTIRLSGMQLEVTARPDDLYFQSQAGVAEAVEPAVDVARHVMVDESVALDIGACLGTISLAWSHLAPAGKIVAVEPNASAIPGLRATLARAPGDVVLVEAGAGAMPGQMRYVADPSGSAWGHVAGALDRGGAPVDTVTVDQLVDELHLERVDLVKIDVEGFELDVLEGASATVATHRPVLVVELNPFCLWRYGRTLPQDLVDWIRRHHEFVWRVDPDRSVRPIRDDADADRLLADVGTRLDLCDVVAAHRPIELPGTFAPDSPAVVTESVDDRRRGGRRRWRR